MALLVTGAWRHALEPDYHCWSTAQQNYGDAPIALSGTASSGLPVAFTILSGPARVAGNILTITTHRLSRR